MNTSFIIAEHPLLQISLDEEGLLVDISESVAARTCPSCLQPVDFDESGKLVHSSVDATHACNPSIEAVVTKALLSKLNDCEKVYVNPVRVGRRALVPALIIKPSASVPSIFINNKYQPAGISWKSAKGFRMGIFILPNKAASVNKSHYDFIATINPGALLEAFNAIVEASPERNALSVLYELLVNPNDFSEWVKWPVMERRIEQSSVHQENWYECYSGETGNTPAKTCTATVTGTERNDAEENIYILEVSLDGMKLEYQIVRSLEEVLLLDNTGDVISNKHLEFELIRKSCISAVKFFVRQNQMTKKQNQLSVRYET